MLDLRMNNQQEVRFTYAIQVVFLLARLKNEPSNPFPINPTENNGLSL